MLKRTLCLFTILVAAAVFLSGCEDAKAPQAGLATVTYMEVKTRPVTLTTELSGRTSPFMISEVRPQVSGIIKDRLFIEGTDVKEGEILYQIEPDLYQAAYDSAKATHMKAEANEVAAKLLAKRLEQVVRVNAVSKQDYDNAVAANGQAQAEVAAAKAAMDTARINLEYTRVTAPVSGRIGRSSITAGALVTQNQPTALATIQQLDPMYVDVTQSSTELLRLRRAFNTGELKSSGETAMQATLKLEDGSRYMQRVPKKDPATGDVLRTAEGKIQYELKPIIGTLKFSEVTVEQSTGVVTIRALFPNPEGTLLPGMYVRAILEEGISDRAILIPQKAVIRNNRGLPVAQVLIRDAGAEGQDDVFTVESRVLTVDRAIDNQWLVTEGLKEGDLLLVVGSQRARPGVPVKGVREQAADSEPSSVSGQNARQRTSTDTPASSGAAGKAE